MYQRLLPLPEGFVDECPEDHELFNCVDQLVEIYRVTTYAVSDRLRSAVVAFGMRALLPLVSS